ncbi:MAG: hypothetical protein HY590_05130 [Candidatus Omnitrophica bacterium]|nr:hypothetical protein [Candidatus Omnitrophota bacterium]
MRLDRGQIEVIDEKMAEILRRKSPQQRLQIGFEMWESAREMIRSYLSSEHPEWSETELDRGVARRLLHGAA